MNDLMADMVADAAPETGSVDTTSRLAAAAHNLSRAMAEADRTKKISNEAAIALYKLRTADLPDLMKELRCTAWQLDSGETMTLSEDVTVSLTGKYREPALAWLRETPGGEAMIANELVINIPKGKGNEVAQIEDVASKLGFDVKRTEAVHSGSFKAFVNALRKVGTVVPIDDIGVKVEETVSLKKGKK